MEQQDEHELLFTGGNHSDNTPSLQPPNTYRGLKGYSLTSLTENSYAFESEKGNTVTFSLNPKYTAIGFNVMNRKVLIHSTNDTFVTNNIRKGEVGMVDISPLTNSGTYIPLYCHKDFNYRINKQIEGWCFYENSKIQRDYWTDDFNPPRVLNFALPVFITYFGNAGLTIGNRYMVLQGTIVHAGISYGPDEIDNVFTATGTTYTGVGLVIAYVPVELFDWMPRYSMGKISYNKWLTGGNVMCGSYQVAYQSVGLDGVTTPWSFVTKPVHVSAGFPAASIVGYQGDQGGPNTTNSGKGLEFIISDLDTNFTTVRVVAIRFTDYNIQDQPVLFFEGAITGTSMTVPFYGNENLTQLTSADIQELNVYIKRMNSIAPMKNRMTGLNWDSAINVDFDPSSAQIDIVEYMCPTDSIGTLLPTNGAAIAAVLPFMGHKRAEAAGIASGNILPLAWYEVTVAPITYNATVYNPGDYFLGIFGVNTFVGAGTIYAVIRIRLYGTTYEYTRIPDDWYDSKGSLIDNKIRSLWRFETYRYGLMLRDLSGNPVYVRWLGDKKMPSQWNVAADVGPDGLPYGVNGELSQYNSATQETVLRHLGVEINNIDFSLLLTEIRNQTGDNTIQYADFPKYFSGFSIVRAARDKQVFAQGVMAATHGSGGGTPGVYANGSFDIANNNGGAGDRVAQCYNFYSPDYEFELNNQPNPQEGDWLRIENYLIRRENFGFAGWTANFIEKFPEYLPNATVPGPLPGTILFPNLASGFTPKGEMVPIIPERSAPVEPNADFNFFSGQTFHNWTEGNSSDFAIGARTYFFVTNYTEGVAPLQYGFGYWRGGFSAPPVVSVVRPKSNLYGGNSDNAKANTLYEYCGHYQKFDTAFLAYLQANAGMVSGIQVFGGDCFITYVDIARGMYDDTHSHGGTDFGITTCYPVESNVNVSLREGIHSAKDGPSNDSTGLGLWYPTRVEQWVYNPAYSSDELFYTEPAYPVNFIPNNEFIAQAIYSNEKLPGEFTDAFRKWQAANKRDLEGLFGAGIKLIIKNGALYAIQENGISYLPIEERSAIPVGLNAPMIIGTGGVMPRYDNTDSYYGTQHQWSVMELPEGFIFFDGNRKSFCYLQTGKAISLSIIKGRDTFFQNEIFGSVLTFDTPVNGVGIASVYDSRRKLAIMVFKDNTRLGNGDHTITFDVKNKQFLGEELYFPGIMFNMMEHLYSAYEGISLNNFQANHTYSIGDIVGVGSENYVCILGYTTSGTPLQPSLDTTHWALANKNNDIYIHNTNDIGKFYGIVRDEELTVVFNPNHKMAKFFNNYEFIGNDVFFDDAEVSNNTQSGQDTGIVLGPEENYWFYNNKHFGSIPMTALGERLKDVFLVARFVKKNRLNNSPVTSTNKTLRLSSIVVRFTKAP